MAAGDKPLAWLHGVIKSPSFSVRLEAGFLLRRLQRGEKLGLPHSRPMPALGRRCHELRVNDDEKTWRIMYRIDADAVVILEVFAKKSGKTLQHVIDVCKQRLRQYDSE